MAGATINSGTAWAASILRAARFRLPAMMPMSSATRLKSSATSSETSIQLLPLSRCFGSEVWIAADVSVHLLRVRELLVARCFSPLD